MFPLSVVVGTLALGTLSAYAQAVQGCVSSSLILSTGVKALSPANYAECLEYCATSPSYPYALWSQSFAPVGGSSYCACADTAPTATDYVDSIIGATSCIPTDTVVTALDTTFIFNDAGGCYSNFESDFNPGQAATMSGCFQLCRFFPVTYASPLTASGSFDCRCSNTLFTGTTPALVCGRGTWFGFSHSPDATVSGLARRHAARARLVEAAKKNTKCPNGLAACPVLGWDSYECIDTDTELESCGGCRYADSAYEAGVDCTSIPNVALGGVTCFKGQCQIKACQPNFALVAGECEPEYLKLQG